MRSLPRGMRLIALLVSLSYAPVARGAEDAALKSMTAEANALKEKGDFAAAATAYQRTVEKAEKSFGAEDVRTASVLNELGAMYWEIGQYATAEPALQRCLKIRQDKLGANDPAVADTLNTLANVLRDTYRIDEADRLYERSMKIRETRLGPDDPEVAKVLLSWSNLCKTRGENVRAEEMLKRSLHIRETKFGRDNKEVVGNLNNLATLYQETDRSDQAIPLLQRAINIGEKNYGPDHPYTTKAVHNLAIAYFAIHKYSQAEALFQRYLKNCESKLGPNSPEVAKICSNLGGFYESVAQFEKSIPLLQRSVRIYEQKLGTDNPLLAKALCNLGDVYRKVGRPVEGEALLLRSMKIAESRQDAELLAECSMSLGDHYYETNRCEQAKPLFERSLKALEAAKGADSIAAASLMNNLANVDDLLGQYGDAEVMSLRCLALFNEKLGLDHPKTAICLHNLATRYAREQKWDHACTAFDRTRKSVRNHVSEALAGMSEADQIRYLNISDMPQLHMALCLGLAQRENEDIATKSASWLLNGKGITQVVLAERTLLARNTNDSGKGDLAKELWTVRNELSALTMAFPKPGQEENRRKQIASLTDRERELILQLGQQSDETAGKSWIETNAVRKSLKKKSVLVEIVRLNIHDYQAKKDERRWKAPRYVAWVVPPAGEGRVEIVDLGDAREIETTVGLARLALQNAPGIIVSIGEKQADGVIKETLDDLARLILRPLLSHIGSAEELLLCPDGALWLVPWAALPLDDGKYAIERYRLNYVNSGRDVIASASTAPRGKRPVVFADPDYDLAPAEAAEAAKTVLKSSRPPVARGAVHASTLASFGKVTRLPGTAAEARAVEPKLKQYAKSDPVMLTSKLAQEAIFKSLHGPQVLIVSTHGFAVATQQYDFIQTDLGARSNGSSGNPFENPLLGCGLLMAGCNVSQGDDASGNDGILTGLEIVGTDLRGTDLVVLSACDTGLGQVRNGEGVAGLRQAFQLAGARDVVATLWSIPDKDTATLVGDMFTSLAGGQTAGDALRTAQLKMIEVRRKKYGGANPFFWAAFTLTGR